MINAQRNRAARLRAPHINTEALESRVLLSTYYVATGGADDAPGTLAAPLRTIQAAAGRAQAGDTVLVRGGTYRETVTPARSGTAAARITFAPYNGESVTVSGADPVGGWSAHAGSIHKAQQGWDLGEGNNQVFVDGRMMFEARWPNTPSLDVSRQRKATADSIAATFAGQASYATLADAELTFPAGAWDGGVVHIASGEGWVVQSGRVTSSPTGRLNFNYEQRTNIASAQYETPRGGDPYYLSGKFVALDSPGEWYRDPTDGRLYLWAPAGDNPAAHAVEAKRRAYAFDLRGRDYIDVKGFKLFAATITTDANSNNDRLDGLDVRYAGHFSDSRTGWEGPADSGITLAGADNVLRNSTIAFSAGDGVNISGERQRVENNTIRDTGYAGANSAAVVSAGAEHLITRNTIYNAGRTGIRFSRTTQSRIVHNDIHDIGLQATDLGGIYTYGADGQGTEIAYNRVYNVRTGGFGGVGIYLDNGSNHYVVHHNVTWNVDHGVKMNHPSYDNQIYNNSLRSAGQTVATSRASGMVGSVFRNNVFEKSVNIGSVATQSNNLYAGTDPRYVNVAANDYRLAAGSPAIDFGARVSPYTDGHAGAAPDAGAYEYGRTPWTAGASTATTFPDRVAPAAPRSLTASGRAAGVLLTWAQSPETDRIGYDVYRSAASAGTYVKVNAEPVGVPTFLDSTAPVGATSYYRVYVTDSSDNRSGYAGASAFLPVPAAVPAAPAGLVAAPAAGAAIDLSWAASPDVFGYRVERLAPGASAFVEIGRTGAPRFRDSGAAAQATYTYRVRAENVRGLSGYGNAVSSAPLAAPRNLSATVASATRADLAWSAVPGALTYDVQRSADGVNNWLRIASVHEGDTTYADVSVGTDRAYSYRVFAVGTGGLSGASNVARTGPQLVSSYRSVDVSATPAGSTRVVTADSAYDVTGGGTNIFGTADSFRFAYKSVVGDFDVKARVQSLQRTTVSAKAGLMVRESLAANSRNVFSLVTAEGRFRYSTRAATGGNTSTSIRSATTFPAAWVRLRRVGNTFTGYSSTDGVAWTQTGTTTMALPQTVLFGMAVTSANSAATATAQFRNLGKFGS